MNPDTYDQIPLDHETVAEAMKYIRENDNATIKFYQGKLFQ